MPAAPVAGVAGLVADGGPGVGLVVDPTAGVGIGVVLASAPGVGVVGFADAGVIGGGVTAVTESGAEGGGAGVATGGGALAVVTGSVCRDFIHIAIALMPISTTTPATAASVQFGFFGVAGTDDAVVTAFGAVGVGTGCDNCGSSPDVPGALVPDPMIGSARGGVVAINSGGTEPDVSTSIGNPARPRRNASRN